MATKVISQKEYLKKYLSGDKKKKKVKKPKTSKATVKIIDDDIHVNDDLQIDEELLLTGEDAPQIVGIINASGEEPEKKWKSFGDIKKEEPAEEEEEDRWGKKASDLERKHFADLTLKKPNQKTALQRNTDQSPPRKKRDERKQKSPVEKLSRWGRDVSSTRDQSPPRKVSSSRIRRDSDNSPPRKTQTRRDSDQSPPRRRSPVHIKKEFSYSPQRNEKSKSRNDSDQSPPRRRSQHRQKKDSNDYKAKSRRDSDQSPPRKRSPQRKRRDSDQSPPRKRSNSDQSPPRRKTNRFSSDTRIKRENSSDQSPPRRPTGSENPFRTSIKVEKPSPERSQNRNSESPPPTNKRSELKMSKTLDGKRAGLQDAQTLRIETEERRRNEDRMFSKMSKEVSGRDAEVQVRKSSYRRHRKYNEEDPEVQRQKAEHEEKKKQLYSRWNKGIKQIEAYQARVSDEQYESSKPLARYSNDADLDEMLRQKEYEDDPMLAYIRSKKQEQQLAAKVPVMPKYKGSFPENRFGIPPGYRWDGVDRSNGYEKKWFDVQSSKLAVAEEAHRYSVAEM